jgi:hypothetical protein
LGWHVGHFRAVHHDADVGDRVWREIHRRQRIDLTSAGIEDRGWLAAEY